ncbi:MAG: hypothetical protein AAFO03_15035 [Bacteroidota bacterium]
MRLPPLFLLIVLLTSYACQRNNQHLFLRLDTQIYNSNFPLATSVSEEGLVSTMMVGTQGIQKVATRSVDVDLPDGRFRFSLIDMNHNNRFGEVGVDLLVLSPFQQEVVPINLGTDNVGTLRPSNIIQVDRSFFLITNIDPTGETVELLAWERAPRNSVVANMQTRMKQIPVHNIAQEETHLSLRNENGKSTLLIVWNYQEGSTRLIRALQDKQEDWQEEWQVVGINMRDEATELQEFLEQTPLAFPTYLMSSQSCGVLDCHALPPYALLLDDKGRVIQQGIKAEGLWSWLAQFEQKKASS